MDSPAGKSRLLSRYTVLYSINEYKGLLPQKDCTKAKVVKKDRIMRQCTKLIFLELKQENVMISLLFISFDGGLKIIKTIVIVSSKKSPNTPE